MSFMAPVIHYYGIRAASVFALSQHPPTQDDHPVIRPGRKRLGQRHSSGYQPFQLLFYPALREEKIDKKPHGRPTLEEKSCKKPQRQRTTFFFLVWENMQNPYCKREMLKPSIITNSVEKVIPWRLKKPRFVGWDRSNPVLRPFLKPCLPSILHVGRDRSNPVLRPFLKPCLPSRLQCFSDAPTLTLCASMARSGMSALLQ